MLKAQDQDYLNDFECIFNSAPIGKAIVAPDGRFLRINQAFCELVGYTPDELLATNFQKITHPDDLEKDLDLLKDVLSGKKSTYQMEKRYVHRSGEVVWVLLNVALIRKEDGQPKYFISQVVDI